MEHLSRGTDDAGEPHRIYFELPPEGTNSLDTATGEPMSAAGTSGGTLLGVGSISALDVLLVSNQLLQGMGAKQMEGCVS